MPPFIGGLAREGLLWEQVRQAAQTDILEKVKAWYVDLPQDWFDNPNPFPDGTSRRDHPRRWMYQLSQGGEGATAGWHAESDGETLSVSFMNPDADKVAYGLRLQQYGGTINPVRAAALTIPLTAEAQGVSAGNFPHELFLLKGDDLEPDEVGTLVWEDDLGFLHAAYALRKSSTIPPLRERRGHDALPSEEELARFAAESFTAAADAVMFYSS